jgi:hypothetical protein
MALVSPRPWTQPKRPGCRAWTPWCYVGAASVLPTPDLVRRQLAREYLTLAGDAAASSADPSVHDALSVVMRVVDACRERLALIAELGDEILAHLEQVSDEEPLSREEHGAVVERARSYKATVHELIRQARDMGNA